ncbi:hypothetical protein B0O99DRAFT_595389 [Bisporella sp. PMI_857]|nr:hypothetical protein B0O99DRAFT_595389 [Bisporella sp. PMI_857]
MLASLLRPKRGRRRIEHSPFSSQYNDQSSPLVARNRRIEARHATADFTETDIDDEITEDDEEAIEDDEEDEPDDDDDGGGDDEDGDEDTPLLPIFSAAHLDALPVYNLTHAIRLIVLPRTETTLSWDQLRSPQVSQFLVKPMQQQIRTSHFSRATLYALMANCLQFQKESQANPGNAGNSRTRALVCELLAIKLLKEYNTRELIDALSYDFFPLQGLAGQGPSTPNMSWERKNRPKPAAARISTLEVAIRASAKRFLAHPLVVQQLEAIWAGTIVFHSAADNLHRPQPERKQMQELRRRNENSHLLQVPINNTGYGTQAQPIASPDKPRNQQVLIRRTVTLYDPRDASLFKLSRLRVPRYRQFFSTCSLAILLVLFLAVLVERSMDITTLEVIFWFWSAGFMLDEVVGFNEQGFSLYIMSFWNTFDLGILLFLIIYYAMRLYGIFLVDFGRREWNNMAYDVLAANAVLLFPRLFSVLDHYRYFSQLLIAFRLMAVDLIAVFVLILIACSGFFVAFTMSFGENEYDGAEVAYRIFQILMGFTPAAWEAWPTYNVLGKALLISFLIICHFLVVTILITVLTNSFMAIVSNANEEHQFVFAVNTISMVKNDALFSYVAPSNIFAWLLTPFRFCLPFKTFIKANRTAIKVTHFPLLFGIYAYEKLFLASSVFEPTDLIENRTRSRKRLLSFKGMGESMFSPNIRMRQDSVAGFQKDRALDEVFRLAPRGDTLRNNRKDSNTHNVVNNWIDRQDPHPSPPPEQDRSVVDRLEKRRRERKASFMRGLGTRRVSATRSVASDPAEFSRRSTKDFYGDERQFPEHTVEYVGHTDADGDDELLTNDEDEGQTLDKRTTTSHAFDSDKENEEEEDYFHTPATARRDSVKVSSSVSSRHRYPGNSLAAPKSSPPKRRQHNRQLSTQTILFNPVTAHSSSTSPPRSRPMTSAKHQSSANTASHTPAASHAGNRTPKHVIHATAYTKPRPIMPGRTGTVPNFKNEDMAPSTQRLPQRQVRHRRSSLDMGMSELGLDTAPPLVPSSFATQMALATGGLKALRGETGRGEDDGMMGRLMLARMKTLEEGFAEVVREVRGMRTAGNSSVEGNNETSRVGKGGEAGWKGKGKEKAAARRKKEGLPRTKSDVDVHRTLSRGGQYEEGIKEEQTPEAEILEKYMAKGSSL